ncbi:MAG: S1 RNA-binding domain-containing protein [Candidatus Gracilibacteria bacterium]|nr:S1 RNA-binding domain-containing protein [Candidatus Gracilibacteria bacterium]
MLQEPIYKESVASELNFGVDQVTVVLDLIAEGATVPFIARYRKEKTRNLDEDQIRMIVDCQKKQENLFSAKQTAINGITEQEKMTEELMQNIVNAKTLKEVEEIYKPYKSKKKTKAMVAIEKGFQVIADLIKENVAGSENGDIIHTDSFQNFLGEYTTEEILEGAHFIVAAEISTNSELRDDLRETIQKYAKIVSKIKTEKALEKLNEKDTKQIPKFDIYSDFSCTISRLKPYQILALNRGENLGIISVKVEKTEMTYDGIKMHYRRLLELRGRDDFSEILEAAFKEGYTTLFKSVETEIRGVLNELGEDDAISSFQSNLEKLLMTKPEYGKNILAIDPGFASGCKIAVLDALGKPLEFSKIFLHAGERAKAFLKKWISQYNIEVIIIGNGTGCNESTDIVQDIFSGDIFIVNESGASVYSASKIAQEEFPELDSLDRGTVSIGRRFIDPLSELVKVPVGSIGVGMYQHDMPVKKLEEKLGYVVEDVVNQIGINVNVASSYVLNHVSGIDKRAAKKIYNHRPYSSRSDLKKQMSEKVYEQAIGFLRVPESIEKLDNTDIHPEQYALAEYIITHQDKNISLEQFFEKHSEKLVEIYPDVTVGTIEFILESLENIGKDPRVHSSHQKAGKKLDIKTIQTGDIFEGIVRNVVAFGAFVDIGLKNDGLVHISQMVNRYISDPKEVVEVGQKVQVKLMSIDEKSGKIQLSMKEV